MRKNPDILTNSSKNFGENPDNYGDRSLGSVLKAALLRDLYPVSSRGTPTYQPLPQFV